MRHHEMMLLKAFCVPTSNVMPMPNKFYCKGSRITPQHHYIRAFFNDVAPALPLDREGQGATDRFLSSAFMNEGFFGDVQKRLIHR